MTLLKRTLFCVFGVMQCVYVVRGSKNTLFSTYCTLLLLLYAPPSETRKFLQSSLFWEARCALIGQLSSALWLAECLKRETEMLRPSPYCDGLSWQDETKTIKPITNDTFVASSGDIITDYNDLDCLFTHRVASRRVNITMSAFVIGETTNNKHYSTLLKTRVWIVSSRNVLTVSQKHQTVLAKLELPPL